MVTVSGEGFNSFFSIQPLVSVLKKMIGEGKTGVRKLYQNLLQDIESQPELLKPIEDNRVLETHAELIETLLSTIFPPSTSATQGMFAVSFPFRTEIIYASPSFKDQFMPNGSNCISIASNKTNYTITRVSLSLAYNIILQKFYGWDMPVSASSVHQFVDEETGLTRFLELNLNAQFVDVSVINKSYKLPTSYTIQRSLDLEELKKNFPLDSFRFEGLVVVNAHDVTRDQVIQEIKNTLLNINAFSDVSVFDRLQDHIQTFLGLTDVSVGITPFFKINEYYLFSDLHYKNSILFRNGRVQAGKRRTAELAQETFQSHDQPLLYHEMADNDSADNELIQFYYEQGARSLIICPLKCDDGQLIGLLEIMSPEPDGLRYHQLSRLGSAMPLFALALEKSLENLESQIDKTIKDHFTAIQSAVEWKFTEAAFEYLQLRQENELARLPSITFNEVYPLYAVVDIRNSSTERNTSIQLDLMEQLNLVHQVLEKATSTIDFPLLKEIEFKVENYINASTDHLLSDDELMIYEFLQKDIDVLFRHLRMTQPGLEKMIDSYFAALDPQKNILYHHRKQYEDTVTKINDSLDRFMDREQAQVQPIYPHYFERYITDGIEFNIYIGQSLAPHKPFNDIYVSNLKMWQLTMLVKAARLTHSLEKKLPLPLQTTQLILAHSIPLSISFRRKERKFDVDGAYNIRYEIVKKRIDKVHLRDSHERLTQPGKIAIVYSQQKELNEYMEYISYLQHLDLLKGDVEHAELEELQGISGLKAIRVDVNLDGDPNEQLKITKAAAHPVLRK